MGVGKEIEKRSHIIGFQEEISSINDESIDKFFSWFNNDMDANAAFITGAWDFSYHIITPIMNQIKNPEELTILEIGSGGCRILANAARYFKKAIGVDIHNENDIVLRELNERGISNIELYKNDGYSIPIAENSVDIVYSFIVLQHIEKIEYFIKYLKEINRVLKKDGIAVIYFGRLYKYSFNKTSKLLLWFDRVYEHFMLKGKFIEIPARVNAVNLRISLRYAKKYSKIHGFKVVKILVSRRNVPNGVKLFGGQNGLVLKK